MDATKPFRFPSSLPSSHSHHAVSPISSTMEETHHTNGGSMVKSPTFSTVSNILSRKSGAGSEGVGVETFAKIRRKISSSLIGSTQLAALTSDWTVGSVLPIEAGPSRISTSQSISGLHLGHKPPRRRHGIARSVTGPLNRFFGTEEHDEDDEGNGSGWDFVCCGEPPVRPEHREAGWLGEPDVHTASPEPTSGTIPEVGVVRSSSAVPGLGSAWSEDHTWGFASADAPLSPPPFTSPSSSHDSTEYSIASPSSFHVILAGHHSLDSPASSILSPGYFPPSSASSPSHQPVEEKRSVALRRSKAVPTRRLKISIHSISSPILTSFEHVGLSAPNTPSVTIEHEEHEEKRGDGFARVPPSPISPM